MKQEYSKYTKEDHKVWSLLFADQMAHLPDVASEEFLKGLKKAKFEPDMVPDFNVINHELKRLTSWEVYAVPGIIDNQPFFEHLSRREFPATTWLRKLSQLKYIEEPDMFHDVFGHVPLLSEQFFCNFLEELSQIALVYIGNPKVVELITRMYWYTVEFGLIRENGIIKIYGAGILSSAGESKFCLSEEAVHLEFDVSQILESSYVKETFQAKYFIIDSYEQLLGSLGEIKEQIKKYVDEDIEVIPSYPKVLL